MKAKETFEAAGHLLGLTIAILGCLLIVKMSLGLYHATVHAWQSIQSHPTLTQQKAAAEARAKDPTNPKVIAQKCLDHGGTPTFSAWDGRVTSCKGTDNKSVNIEVNQ